MVKILGRNDGDQHHTQQRQHTRLVSTKEEGPQNHRQKVQVEDHHPDARHAVHQAGQSYHHNDQGQLDSQIVLLFECHGLAPACRP